MAEWLKFVDAILLFAGHSRKKGVCTILDGLDKDGRWYIIIILKALCLMLILSGT